MLHAVIHNKKARLNSDARIWEDNVTSTFFGPLCFLPVEEVIALLVVTFPSIEDSIVDKGFEYIEFDFWKRVKLAKGSNRKRPIEPDLLIRFKSNKSEQDDFLLLVEVKWKGYEDKYEKHQVHEQIEAIKYDLKPKEMRAIYLTQYDDKKPDKKHGGVAIDCITWLEIAQRHRQALAQVSAGAQQWQQSVVEYLEKLLDTLFYGFTKERFAKPNVFIGEKVFFSPFIGFTNPEVPTLAKNFFFGESS